jgi:hypothetical protein
MMKRLLAVAALGALSLGAPAVASAGGFSFALALPGVSIFAADPYPHVAYAPPVYAAPVYAPYYLPAPIVRVGHRPCRVHWRGHGWKHGHRHHGRWHD